VRHICAFAAGLALVAGTGCSDAGDRPTRVVRLASADPAGIAHDPAISFFVDRVAKLSNGRLRIAVDERWAPSREKQLLLDVARGDADLGWSHTSSFEEIGVRSFEALHAPMLVDGYGIERAVVQSPLATQMLAGTRSVGLHGLALLSGPLSRLDGVGQAMRKPEDLHHLAFGVHGAITVKSTIPQTPRCSRRARYAPSGCRCTTTSSRRSTRTRGVGRPRSKTTSTQSSSTATAAGAVRRSPVAERSIHG
jgi:TRAP-type C4-dicarboxylate transport system substrate-binding protein